MPRYTYECVGADETHPCGFVTDMFYHCDDTKPRVLNDTRCPKCSGLLRRDMGADARTIGTRIDSIAGGRFIPELPYPPGYKPPRGLSPTARAEHARKHARYHSEAQIHEAIATHNAKYPDKPGLHIHEMTVAEATKNLGISQDHVDAIKAGGKDGAHASAALGGGGRRRRTRARHGVEEGTTIRPLKKEEIKELTGGASAYVDTANLPQAKVA